MEITPLQRRIEYAITNGLGMRYAPPECRAQEDSERDLQIHLAGMELQTSTGWEFENIFLKLKEYLGK